jgi:L-alanine-DL-glutamate epimerase-like enolase superfamily enzyme
MRRSLEISRRDWPMTEPFAIARGVQLTQPTLQLVLRDRQGHVGRGEACGIPYEDETPETMAGQIRSIEDEIEAGLTRDDLLSRLPAGGARNAIDAALWDLEAKQSGRDAFAIADLVPSPVVSAFTIGIRSVADYETTARRFAGYPVLKIKVNGQAPMDAIDAVRRGAPDARLIVDPNQSWSVDQLKTLAPELAARDVVLIEQPIAVGAEAGLDGWISPVPLCADELIAEGHDLAVARGRFQFINIKLDKAGGLTAALALADAAQAQGFGLMVGCMAGSSLSMAPAMVLARRCTFVDLDGPLLQSEDCDNGFVYNHGRVEHPLVQALWG